MDLAAILGLLIAFGAIFSAQLLEGGSPLSILLPAPLILVFLGTFGAALAGGVLKDGLSFFSQVKRALTAKVPPPDELVDIVVRLAERARREGLLALEDTVKEVDDTFLKRGLQLAIDGTDPDELGEILYAEVDAKRKADKASERIFEAMGGYAPTIGIIGTVMGLVHALENLDDPAQLGHAIAAAFVATLWGVMSANAIWLPLASRLRRISELECEQMELAIEGVLAIQAGANPRLIAQKLRSLLPPDVAKVSEAKNNKKAA
ncbi:MAG: flagellar motor protein [Actinobacteria bacterium]|nr:MAG: flagellar motor protein [Actinomycetota bacterium]